MKDTEMFLPHPLVKLSIVGSLRDREVACSASDRQGSNFESCVWRTVSSHSSHHPQEVLLAQFSLYVHKSGLKPDSFYFLSQKEYTVQINFENYFVMSMKKCRYIIICNALDILKIYLDILSKSLYISVDYSKQGKTIRNDLELTFDNCDDPTLDGFCEHNNQSIALT